MTFVVLYFLFVKYGFLSFGGGYMLVPLFIHDLVESYGVISYQEFGNLVAIAQMTPGPIGINTATYIGYLTHGVPGALLATAGLLTPAVILVILAAFSFKKWEHNPIVQGMLGGMRPATLGLIISAILIFADMAIFTHPLPIPKLLEFFGIPANVPPPAEPFGICWSALAIAAASCVLLGRFRINVIYIIFGAALFGAFFIR